MTELIKGAGVFIYPLGLCSLVAAFIIFERLFALRKPAILPPLMVSDLVNGRTVTGDPFSVLGRVVGFSHEHRHDEDAVKAFARMEINRMERGLVFVEIITGAAPLLGLLGTVTGLLQVFSNIAPETGIPDQAKFTQGIALALTTTVLGLAIAIPSLIGCSYLQRRIETYAVQLDALIERLHLRRQPEGAGDKA